MTAGVVIVVWNGARWLADCIGSVIAQSTPPSVLVVVDNASGDHSLQIATSFESEASRVGTQLIVLPQLSNEGFTAGANGGLRYCLDDQPAIDVLVLLNQDAILDADWCERVTTAMADDRAIGALGSRILDPSRLTIRHAGGYIEQPSFVGVHFGRGAPATAQAFGTPRNVEFVTAAAMALRAQALREVGVFNELFSPGYYEDVELCTRLRQAGWLVQYRPEAVAAHVESGSFGDGVARLMLSHRNRILYALPWLEDSDARQAFVLAEKQLITNVSSHTERRALGLAYLAALLMLPDAARERQPQRRLAPDQVEAIVSTLGALRRFSTERPLAAV